MDRSPSQNAGHNAPFWLGHSDRRKVFPRICRFLKRPVARSPLDISTAYVQRAQGVGQTGDKIGFETEIRSMTLHK